MLDPALPLGLVGPRLRRPYGLVLHGAEVTVPGRLPGTPRRAAPRAARRARSSSRPAATRLAEAERAAGRRLPAVVVPPGVDADRFRPLDDAERERAARQRFGLPVDARARASA